MRQIEMILMFLSVFISWLLILSGAVEAVWGLCQVYGYTASNHSLYALTDITLTNVEALAYYVEGEFGDYECEAPYNAQCSVELGVPLKGYRYNFD